MTNRTMMNTNTRYLSFAWLLGLLLCQPALIWASSTSTGLPWESPINTIRDSLTGPVAVSIGAIGFFVAGGLLIFGGEIADFTKWLMYAVLAASIMLLGGTIVSTLFTTATLI